MEVKYDSKVISLTNESNVKGEFYTYWNDYFIQVAKDDDWIRKEYGGKAYIVLCINPLGTCDVDACCTDMTIKECVQMCFDNIGVPPLTVGDEIDEGEEAYWEHMDIYCP